ncbi:MAG: large subunit ribosomal protein [Humisphaera sp.]|jgi:large subunit ribosomal protein L20|nr:large subunit ribosomal protein [Humisphaera sp.]
MPRSTGGPTHARKRKRILKRASGFRGGPGTIYRQALEFTRKADVYAYRDRRQKKRHFRSLWITRLNAALKERGVSYSRFIPAMALSGVGLNRKMLSELAITDPAAFDAIVAKVKPHIVGPKKKAAAAA